MARQTLGAYELLAPLGSGGMAEVHAARCLTPPGELVVVKQMLPQYVDTPAYVEMFLDEGRAVSLLRHPNVVRMHAFGFHGERPYLAMEYLHGVDLRSVMRAAKAADERIPLAIALAVVEAICAGLYHAHDAHSLDGYPLDIVHRDVSPQNIVVTFDGIPKLIDFGIAKSRGQLHETRGGGLKGKIPYMSPEQVRGLTVDRRSDIYAVGVILYELVAGRRPYVIPKADQARGEFSLMMAIVGHRLARLADVRPDLPPRLYAIVDRALAASADDRYATAEDLRRDVALLAASLGLAIDPAAIAAYLAAMFGDQYRARWEDLRRESEEVVTRIVELMQVGRAADGDEPTAVEDHGRADDAREAPSLAPTAPAVVRITGRIDETFDGAARAATLEATAVLDLAGVERISSYGVREWLALQRGATDRGVELYLARCAEAFVSQLGMVRALAGRARIVSFVAPYLCPACGATFAHAFDCERDAPALADGASPLVGCPRCRGAARLDDDVAYFAPLAPHLGAAVPLAVRHALAATDDDQGAHVDKQIDGGRTRVRLLRAVDASFRWGRVLDGVEGTLELDVGAAALDAAAIAALVTALQTLGPEVRAITIANGAPALADAVAEPRVRIAAVRVDGRCPSCATTRGATVSLAELQALRAGGGPVVACRRCDTPLVALALGGPPPRSARAWRPAVLATVLLALAGLLVVEVLRWSP